MASKTPKPVPLTEDEAATWLTFATIHGASADEAGNLVLTRDDGAVLHVSVDFTSAQVGRARLVFTAEGATV